MPKSIATSKQVIRLWQQAWRNPRQAGITAVVGTFSIVALSVAFWKFSSFIDGIEKKYSDHISAWISLKLLELVARHPVYSILIFLASLPIAVLMHAYVSSILKNQADAESQSIAIGLTYDRPIRDALVYIAGNMGRNENYCEAARSLIRQEALNGNLILWGRKQIDPPERFKNLQELSRRFSEVITVIPSDYWRVSVLSAGALTSGYANVPCTLEENVGDWPKSSNAYSDIFVNWQQIQDLTSESAP